MDIYSGLAFIFSLCYIGLAIKGSRLCFVFGFLGSLTWACADYFVYNLKFDFGLNVFYVIMSIVGWISWKEDATESYVIKGIQSTKLVNHAWIIVLGLITSLLLVYILNSFTTTNLPYLDAITTVFSIIGTILLIKKYIENWIYLIVCDIAYLYIYGKQGAYILMLIMIIYVVLAILGYIKWKEKRIYSST